MTNAQIKKVFYLGLVNVIRNSFVSFSVLFVMTVSLFIVGASLLFGQVMGDVTEEVRSKMDMAVYFVPDTPEQQILKCGISCAGCRRCGRWCMCRRSRLWKSLKAA